MLNITKYLTTREIVFISLMSASLFVVNLVVGGAINAATGIPLSNAFFTAVTIGIWSMLMFKIVPKPGTFTLLLLIYSILEIPTSLGGAPGFWPKIPINVITGLIGDLFLYLANYKRWSIYPAFYVLTTANLIVFMLFLALLKVPGTDKLIKIAPILIAVYWVVGSVGLFLGNIMYKRIENKKVVRMIKT